MWVARLEHLKNVLKDVERRDANFHMGAWFEPDPFLFKEGVSIKHVCGTSACALGFAALDPVFQACGLRPRVHVWKDVHKANGSIKLVDRRVEGGMLALNRTVYKLNSMSRNDGPPIMQVSYGKDRNLTAAMKFFEITGGQADYLFMPTFYPGMDSGEIAPKDVIEHIDRVLKGKVK